MKPWAHTIGIVKQWMDRILRNDYLHGVAALATLLVIMVGAVATVKGWLPPPWSTPQAIVVGILIGVGLVSLTFLLWHTLLTKRSSGNEPSESEPAEEPERSPQRRRAVPQPRPHPGLARPVVPGNLRDLLQDELRAGEELKARVPSLQVVGYALFPVATEAEVDEWEDRVCALLRPRPRLLAQFEAKRPDPLHNFRALGIKYVNPLRTRLEERLDALEGIIKRL